MAHLPVLSMFVVLTITGLYAETPHVSPPSKKKLGFSAATTGRPVQPEQQNNARIRRFRCSFSLSGFSATTRERVDLENVNANIEVGGNPTSLRVQFQRAGEGPNDVFSGFEFSGAPLTLRQGSTVQYQLLFQPGHIQNTIFSWVNFQTGPGNNDIKFNFSLRDLRGNGGENSSEPNCQSVAP